MVSEADACLLPYSRGHTAGQRLGTMPRDGGRRTSPALFFWFYGKGKSGKSA